jgi:hypothetical protein
VIVRILGEGQFQVAEDVAAQLTALDAELDVAVRKNDDAAFRAALGAAVRLVRDSGTSVPADTFTTADSILPFSDASIDEVRKLLADGTITGSDSIGLP